MYEAATVGGALTVFTLVAVTYGSFELIFPAATSCAIT